MNQEQKLTLIGVFLAMFLAALDQTIVSTAMPRIVQELGATHLYAWVATVYLLTSTVSGPLFGRLTEIMNAKWILLSAVILFLLGSILCGLAPDMHYLIAFRGFQGIGGGALFAVVSTVIGLMFTPRERSKVQGLFGAVFGISSVIGPLLGGLLTDQLSWRWIFYINMPLGIVAICFIIRHMPDVHPYARHRFDWRGAFSLILWTVPFMLAVSWGGSRFAWLSPEILGLLAVTVLGVFWFYRAERQTADPLFDLSLFTLPTFRWANIALFFFGGAFMGLLLFLPLYLVQVKGVSATHSGLMMTPLTVGLILGSISSGRIAARTGFYKRMLAISTVWLLAAILLMHFRLGLNTPLWEIAVMMVVIGLGVGPSMPLYNLAVQSAVPRNRIGTASSATQFFRQIGSTVGAALLGTILAATLQAHLQRPGQPRQAAPAEASQMQAQSPGSLRAGLEQQMEQRLQRVRQALAGNRQAYQQVVQDPLVPADIKARLSAGTRPGAEREAVLEQARQEMRGQVAGRVDTLHRASMQAVTDAVRQVYLFDAVLALLTLLAMLRLPDLELQHHKPAKQ